MIAFPFPSRRETKSKHDAKRVTVKESQQYDRAETKNNKFLGQENT